MAEGRPILSGKSDHQKIGYIEGTDAFDSLGNKRCKYCLNLTFGLTQFRSRPAPPQWLN